MIYFNILGETKKEPCGSSRLLNAFEFLSEFSNTASIGSDVDLASVERMALGASIDLDFRFSRTSFKGVSASQADDFSAIIFRMNVVFHD